MIYVLTILKIKELINQSLFKSNRGIKKLLITYWSNYKR